jgi:hypothetical protein
MAAALVPVEAISAVAMDARVRKALIDVVLAILSVCSFRATTFVTCRKFFAVASILAGPTPALVNWSVTQISTPSRLTVTLEGVNVVNALAVFAGIVVAVIHVDLTTAAGKSGYAVTEE